MSRVSTRCKLLDKRLNGGIPSASIASLVSSPSSQCSPLFHGFLKDRPWLYVTTYRSHAAIKQELDHLLWGNIEVEHVGVERPIKNMHRAMERLDGACNIMVDTMNPLESNGRIRQYTKLLNGLKEYLIETDKIALLHCTEYERTPPQLRETTLTVSDVVLELETVVEGREIKNHLRVPKCRRMQSIDQVIKLDLGKDVTVDTSHNIA